MTASDLTTAAQRLRCDHAHPVNAPHTLWEPGPCQKCGAAWGSTSDLPERLTPALAELLDAIEAHWPSHVVARTGTVSTGRILRAARSIAVVINRSAS